MICTLAGPMRCAHFEVVFMHRLGFGHHKAAKYRFNTVFPLMKLYRLILSLAVGRMPRSEEIL